MTDSANERDKPTTADAALRAAARDLNTPKSAHERNSASAEAPSAAKPRPKSARRWAREHALQGLYEFFVAHHDPVAIRLRIEGEEDFKRTDKEFFREMWRGLSDDWQSLIALVEPHMDRKFDEVSPIERSVILIGTWELKHRLDVPYRVAINESVELAKSFGGTDGHKWVNGVLDKVAPSLRTEEMRR